VSVRKRGLKHCGCILVSDAGQGSITLKTNLTSCMSISRAMADYHQGSPARRGVDVDVDVGASEDLKGGKRNAQPCNWHPRHPRQRQNHLLDSCQYHNKRRASGKPVSRRVLTITAQRHNSNRHAVGATTTALYVRKATASLNTSLPVTSIWSNDQVH
jgi:hypothetical protein